MLPPDALIPDYNGYCLSNVPSTILSMFGVDTGRPVLPDGALEGVETSGIDSVILLLCDGFGYKEWRRQEQKGLVGALTRKGNVRAITTVFPSTTAAALTTVSTGLTPQEHGLPEWYVYMRELGEIIVTLPFSRVGDKGRDTLVGTYKPKNLFQGRTIFQKLREAGVQCTSFSSRPLAFTAYSTVSRNGSDIVPYTAASDLTVSLKRKVAESKGKHFFYAYWSYVDTIEHIYGPNTDEAEVEGSVISHAFMEGFLSKLDREAARRTLMVVTADHGQIQIDPAKTFYLNRFSKITGALDRSRLGVKVPPWGSARDTFLAVEKTQLDDVRKYLERRLEGVASVIETSEAIEMGLFGINKPSRKFRQRVGNLMILPHGVKTVWFRYAGEDRLDIRGHHGGLSKDEMTIPLAVARVSDLQ
jgi:Type I phosphodiesterase / nucleotide pyrophosphatase